MKRILYITLAIITLVACNKTEDQTLEVNTNALTFDAAEGQSVINIISNQSWTATIDQDWASINMTHGTGNATIVVSVKQFKQIMGSRTAKVTVNAGTIAQEIAIVQTVPVNTDDPGNFVIEEIFFTGNVLADGVNNDSGDGDQYIKITNNSYGTLYADGLTFVVSTLDSQTASTGATWVYPELPDSIAFSAAYRIPGNGTDYPVNAGESIILAVTAQNFKSAENPNGFDLSKADFEFVDSENDDAIDNPDVPNMIIWFSKPMHMLHNRGYKSFAIIDIPSYINEDSYMANYAWEGKRTMDWNGFHFEQDITEAWLSPNDWVLDGINCAIAENLGTLAFNSTIDAGYTGCGAVDKDPDRFGKSVLRKRDPSTYRLIDTNNSTNDFIPNATPSLKN